MEKIASGQTTLAELVRVIPYRQIMAAREDRQRGQGQENEG